MTRAPRLRLFEPCKNGEHSECAGFTVDVDTDAYDGIGSECTCECHGPRCPDCGEPGEFKGHMGCQYPED